MSQEARAAAFLIGKESERAGRTWQAAGILPVVSAMLADGLPVDVVIGAGCNAARDRDGAHTPAAIKWDRYRPTVPTGSDPAVCDRCNLPAAACAAMQAKVAPEHADPHEFTPRRRTRPATTHEPKEGPTP